ncbi:MAG TPA: tetratricopeptide repeat protein [Azonexus sp.]|nr:tetratricopeptide repeat protein [Azonexus sp.]
MIKPLFLLAALSLSISTFAADLNQARMLVDQKHYAEAIAVYEVLLTEQTGQADLLIEAARVNAWADRHPAAAELYQRAIAAAPQRRYDVLLPLAWQLAWGGRHDEAIPLFREVAQQVPAQKTEALHGLAESLAASKQLLPALDVYRALAADPPDLKARKGEARILLWLERHDEAILRYRAILDTQPSDKEAQIGLARALNYSGRHFEAVIAYAAAVENDPALARDTRTERATALRWAGLEDSALTTLGDAPGNDSVSLRSRLGQETASHVRAEFESSWDSDDLDIDALSLGWQQRFGAGRWLDVSARGARIDQYGDQIDGRQLLIKGGTRLGSVAQGLFWPALTLGVRDYDGWQTTAWKLQGRWLPADFWRIDLEAGNDVVETIEALRNEVTLNQVSASTDWLFAPRWRATLGAALLRFDDDNQRTRLIGRVEHVLMTAQPRVVVGVEGMGFNDSDPAIDRGYYNPETYRELKALARVEHEAYGWLLEARLALGMLWETPGDSSGLYAWELVAARDLAPELRLRLYAGGSDSSAFLQGTGSGYTRNYLGASLIWFY